MTHAKQNEHKTRTDNKLSVKCAQLTVALEGSAEEVSRAYRSMRTQLTEVFYTTLNADRSPDDRTLQLPRADLMEADDSPADTEKTDDAGNLRPSENFLNLVVCEQTHHKIYLIDDVRFERSLLSKALAIEPIGRIYIDAKVEERVRASLDVGSTLWRQITPAGKAAMRKGD